MTLEGIGLFSGLKGRLDYLNRAQSLTAQNIANADTPDYAPMELKEFDFSNVLKRSRHDLRNDVNARSSSGLQPLVTNGAHINAASGERMVRNEEQSNVVETSPSGNAVDLEEQILKATQQAGQYNLTLNVMRKNVQLIRTAIVGTSR